MEVVYLLWRNVKWRFQNPITIVLTIIQPLIWLLLYSTVFSERMGRNYPAFVLAGILVLVIFSGAGSSGVSNYTSKMDGSFYRILISPVKRSSIVLGHILEAEVLSCIEIVVLLIVSYSLKVRFINGFPGLILIALLLSITVFFIGSLSYEMSLIIPHENAFHTLMNTFVLPVFFVSTALIPYEYIPVHFRMMVGINPFTYVIESIRNLILSPLIDWRQYFFALALMGLLGGIFYILSTRRLQKIGRI